jgi:hypothetical protein
MLLSVKPLSLETGSARAGDNQKQHVSKRYCYSKHTQIRSASRLIRKLASCLSERGTKEFPTRWISINIMLDL